MTGRDALTALTDLVARLRGPEGCPWDREQGLEDVRAYLLEEAHEVAAAIDSGDWKALAGELGDLLFQIAFVARLAEEQRQFDLVTVLERIQGKMIARHPHVFGDTPLPDADAVAAAWERRKLEARGGESRARLLDGIPVSLPALLAAYRMGQKAAGAGFDWTAVPQVLAKVREELGELEAEIASGSRRERLTDELGDLLFATASVGRHLGIDPEAALWRANRRFRARLGHMEDALAEQSRTLADAGPDELDALWRAAKGVEDEA